MLRDSKYLRINIANPLYIIINKADGYFEKISKNEVVNASSY